MVPVYLGERSGDVVLNIEHRALRFQKITLDSTKPRIDTVYPAVQRDQSLIRYQKSSTHDLDHVTNRRLSFFIYFSLLSHKTHFTKKIQIALWIRTKRFRISAALFHLESIRFIKGKNFTTEDEVLFPEEISERQGTLSSVLWLKTYGATVRRARVSTRADQCRRGRNRAGSQIPSVPPGTTSEYVYTLS